MLHPSRKKERQDRLNPRGPRGFVVFGAFGFEVLEIIADLPALLYEHRLQQPDIVDGLPRLCRANATMLAFG
jgi:hypothetical protein